ncbi:MFS transporter [Bradyrhizobium sp. CCGUVB1N3]|uniref:MFS transporter n=1 Tax=Bradyrhizobium sp. CCGUVB1N3 TaxID=2949629 RepID=UPI0020B23408|nr:MFS transporter [Bradyrhizobium sp. CCGUVB1N3]MCP3473990.1 MFS transporter [Bradyrhizobium sp. CCGUVB1N3]
MKKMTRHSEPNYELLFAAASGFTVANNYLNQALLGLLAGDFGLSPAAVSTIPVVTQVGNAVGLILLAPLGDRFERRGLILTTLAALVVALVAAAIAPGFGWLVGASLCVGLFATVTQQLVPFAVHLAEPGERGRALGIVTGGILAGILLARTFAGTIADLAGWRTVFAVAAGLMLVISVLLALKLPRARPGTDLGYRQLLQSLATLLGEHEILRRAVTIQALIFAAFMAFWANLALLLQEPRFGLGPTAVGLIALVGVGGVLAAPLAGRFSDRRGPAIVIATGAGLVVAAFAILGLVQGSLTVLVIAVLVMDLAVQASQVANQARVFAIDPTAHSRLNTIFMAAMIFGGALGAGAGGIAYSLWGWSGICAFGATAGLCAAALSATRTTEKTNEDRDARSVQHQR